MTTERSRVHTEMTAESVATQKIETNERTHLMEGRLFKKRKPNMCAITGDNLFVAIRLASEPVVFDIISLSSSFVFGFTRRGIVLDHISK